MKTLWRKAWSTYGVGVELPRMIEKHGKNTLRPIESEPHSTLIRLYPRKKERRSRNYHGVGDRSGGNTAIGSRFHGETLLHLTKTGRIWQIDPGYPCRKETGVTICPDMKDRSGGSELPRVKDFHAGKHLSSGQDERGSAMGSRSKYERPHRSKRKPNYKVIILLRDFPK